MLVLALLGVATDIENSNAVSDSDDCDDVGDNTDELCAVTQAIINNNVVLLYRLRFLEYKRHQFCHQQAVKQILFLAEHRHLPRQAKAESRHVKAFLCIKRDYFGVPGDLTTPIFKDRSFEMMFRLSRSRVQRIIEDVMSSTVGDIHRFFARSMETTEKMGASYEAKILLPLKTFAYGIPLIHSLISSKCQTARCCDVFALSVKLLYDEEYLHTPDTLDLKRIAKLHKECHGVNGMFGSLDCMHTPWKNSSK